MNEAERRRATRTVPTMGAGGRPLQEPPHVSPARPDDWAYRTECPCLWCRLERVAEDVTAMRPAA